MTAVAIGVFRDHPLEYALTIPVGLYRMLIQVGWSAALARHGLEHGSAAGDWLWPVQALHERRLALCLFFALPCLYFIAGTLVVCTSCFDTRGRTMLTPLLAFMAAYGVMFIIQRRSFDFRRAVRS